MRNVIHCATHAFYVVAFLTLSIPFASAQALTIEVGLSQRVELPNNISEVIVGDPSIVDILPISSNIYILNARKVGTTNVIAVNKNAEQIFYSRINVRPVDIRPNFRIGVTRNVGDTQSYNCNPETGCKPDELATQLTRSGGIDGEGQPEYFVPEKAEPEKAEPEKAKPEEAKPAG